MIVYELKQNYNYILPKKNGGYTSTCICFEMYIQPQRIEYLQLNYKTKNLH